MIPVGAERDLAEDSLGPEDGFVEFPFHLLPSLLSAVFLSLAPPLLLFLLLPLLTLLRWKKRS